MGNGRMTTVAAVSVAVLFVVDDVARMGRLGRLGRLGSYGHKQVMARRMTDRSMARLFPRRWPRSTRCSKSLGLLSTRSLGASETNDRLRSLVTLWKTRLCLHAKRAAKPSLVLFRCRGARRCKLRHRQVKCVRRRPTHVSVRSMFSRQCEATYHRPSCP